MVETFKPQNLIEALKVLNDKECTVFAGGTDLMVKKRAWCGTENNFKEPVLFISDIDEIKTIKKEEGFIKIGAACRLSEIKNSEIVPGILKDVVSKMASPQVRNAATIGGNICNSSPAGDTLPLLYALEAVLVIENVEGKKEIRIQDFITGPSKNILQKNEILTEIKFNDMDFNIIAYKKTAGRNSNALSKVSFVGLAKINENEICDIRISFGAVGPTTARCREFENIIIKMKKDNGKIDTKKIMSMYESIIKPINDQRSTADYRKKVSLRLLKNFLEEIERKNL